MFQIKALGEEKRDGGHWAYFPDCKTPNVSLLVDAWTLAFSPDSQYLATGTHMGKVNIFGVESGKKEYSLDTRGKFILSIAYVRRPPCRVL